jgi:hypothetical protein
MSGSIGFLSTDIRATRSTHSCIASVMCGTTGGEEKKNMAIIQSTSSKKSTIDRTLNCFTKIIAATFFIDDRLIDFARCYIIITM